MHVEQEIVHRVTLEGIDQVATLDDLPAGLEMRVSPTLPDAALGRRAASYLLSRWVKAQARCVSTAVNSSHPVNGTMAQ